MALGKRKAAQTELFVASAQIAKGPGHPFYTKLNELLAKAQFDDFVEKLCAPYYKDGGRPGIPPGIYFRMLFIGYFEGIDSQRGIAWRCADSLALRSFLGLALTEGTPVHASMTIIRRRLPESAFDDVFDFVLKLLKEHGLLQGRTIAIDATTLEANAAMKSIVRKDSGQNWNEYLRGLAAAEGIENPTQDDLRRMDRQRKEKKVSNDDWDNPNDPDARIAKMKDGRTHMAYKAEHAVDLNTEALVAINVTHATEGDAETGPKTLSLAQVNLLVACGPQAEISEAVMDKGYHDNKFLWECEAQGVRTYVPERKQKSRCWADKPEVLEKAFRSNRRRVRSEKGKKLNRLRSERCERTFAHVCETGGGRRSWLRGLENVTKAYKLRCAAYNLGVLMRKAMGYLKPRSWVAMKGAVLASFGLLWIAFTAIWSPMAASVLLLAAFALFLAAVESERLSKIYVLKKGAS